MTTPIAGESRALALPMSARDVALLQKQAEENAPLYASIVVASPEDYETADALLTSVVKEKDAAVNMRQRVVAPAKAIAKEVEGWFRPYVIALETAETTLKGVMGAYRLKCDRDERAAREAAAKAAEVGNAPELVAALTTAAATSAPVASGAARATVRFVWQVKRIIPDLLPDEWWTPDEKKIDAYARAAPGASEDPPVLPGVLFERVPVVGAKR